MVKVFDSSGHRFEAVYLHEAPDSLLDSDDKAAQFLAELCHSYSKRLLGEADFQCAVCSQKATGLLHQPGLYRAEGLAVIRDLPAPTCCRPSCKEIVKQRTHEVKKCVLPKSFKEFWQCAACGSPHPARRCAGCRLASYCNTNCQRTHWQVHKIACRGPKEQFKPA